MQWQVVTSPVLLTSTITSPIYKRNYCKISRSLKHVQYDAVSYQWNAAGK